MFAKLALEHKPDTLFVACSDSRVVPNLFASSDPGHLFVVRNVGNLIPCCGPDGISASDESEAAAIEFSVVNFKIADVIICGHSECGAMHAIMNHYEDHRTPHVNAWLRHGKEAYHQLKTSKLLCQDSLSDVNKLSQLNVLQQLEHLASYPLIKERLNQGTLRIHGWWFDIATADVYVHDAKQNRFVIIDEHTAPSVLYDLKGDAPEREKSILASIPEFEKV